MKKHIALFGTTLLLGSLLGGTGVLAAEDQNNTPDPACAETRVTGKLELSDKGGYNPNPPSSDLNDKTVVPDTAYFGIAYKPKQFNIGEEVKLADSNEEQNVVMQGPTNQEGATKSFHVAVKDKRREKNRSWTLKAKLESAIDDEKLGISIKTGTKADSVHRNINNGTDEFQEAHLISQVQKDNSENEVTNTENLIITTSDKDVMKTVGGKFVNGVYDLELPQVELNIPDASKVAAQTLSTKVVWTLENAAK